MLFRLALAIFATLGVAQGVFAFDQTHAGYERILKETVVFENHQSNVDYAALKAHPEEFDRYLDELQSVSRDEFERWNREQQMAFLINAYNAFTIKLILDHYPDLTSIRDLGGLVFGSPWKKKFFTLFGEPAYLDHIEHDLLRGRYRDPRIHFAVVCASKSCPPLQPEAYVADRLDAQLEGAARNFLTDPERNYFDRAANRLELSSIFNWFKQDFAQDAGSLEKFVARYITDDPEARQLISNRVPSVHFSDYDWSLNVVRQ